MGWHHEYLVEIFLIHVETYTYSGKKKNINVNHHSFMHCLYMNDVRGEIEGYKGINDSKSLIL